MFFPCVAWPLHTRAVNVWAVTCVHTCPQQLCERWLFAAVVLILCLSQQWSWVLSPPHLSPGPWEQVTGWPPSALCPPHWHLLCIPRGPTITDSPKATVSFQCGGRWDFSSASKQYCPVRYMESVQDGHLLALKQSSAFSKISLAPVLDVYSLKDAGMCWLWKENKERNTFCSHQNSLQI